MATKSFQAISFIIPIRNESTHIERGLSAIPTRDYPAGFFEILIADGISTDKTPRSLVIFPPSTHK